MKVENKINKISFDKNFLILEISGNNYRFELSKFSTRLENATENERSFFQISPSGYGIHWPLIDEDISINALLEELLPSESKKKVAI
jgi:Protein of unknown function (DUF2442)